MIAATTGLLDELVRKGAHLEAIGERLRITGSPGMMTPELEYRVRQNKGALLKLLRVGRPPTGDVVLACDLELRGKLQALKSDELAFFDERLRERRLAGESQGGVGWRALVDVRLRFGHWNQAS